MHLFLRRFPALGGLQLFALLCATMAATSSIHAGTIIVTTTADSGAGSLRDAIAAASNGDTIQFDAALNGQSIMLTSEELTINKNITIDGPGADQLAVKKASGSPDFRIFHVLLGHSLILRGLTIDGNGTRGAGVWNDYASVALDGCVVQGCLGDGGVRCFASFNDDSYLTVVNSIIRNNQADTAGGGIYNSTCCAANIAHALVSIRDSIVSNNTVGLADGFSGSGSGGGIWNSGEMDITNSIVSDNVSGGNGVQFPFGNGGGISNQPLAGSLHITNCTISGNSTGLFGGGVYNSAFLLLTSSTVSGNAAMGVNELEGWGEGAAIYNTNNTTITNSTLSNNTATHSGGAASNRGSLTIAHSTLSGNNGFKGSTIANYENGATVQIGNTVLKVTSFPSISNISGTITSNGYNIINDNGGGVFTAPGDQTNTEPMLGPLQNNGGPTFTHELLTGSPAIDAGNPSFAPPPANDQRGSGYARVFNGRIDIGSLEVQPTPAPTPSLGNYPNRSVALSGDRTMTPDATPANITSINVSTSTNFKGTLAGDPTTGVVRVTDAHPAGTYTVTVRAYGPGPTVTRTFTLTVTTPTTCTPVSFAAAATNLGNAYRPVAVAVGDFNGDGKQDLVLTNLGPVSPMLPPGSVSILLGDGAGRFSVTDFPFRPYSVAVGDFNNDGKQDLVVTAFTGGVWIWLGDGAGSFTDRTFFTGGGMYAYSIAVGDFNGDGKQDLAVPNSESDNLSILLGDGTGSFSAATNFGTGPGPYSVAKGDFNGDGKQDLATANSESDTVSILLGDGAGSFPAATGFDAGPNPNSVGVGDFNNDGKQDLAVTNSDGVSILLGNGAGSFTAATDFDAGSNPGSIVVGDFDGDGKQDLAVVNSSDTVSILLGDGVGNFSAPKSFGVGSHPYSVAVGDFNRDGKQDLAVANSYSENVSILLRDCALSPTPTPTGTATPTATATATATPTLTPTPTPTPTATPSPSPARALNISTRMLVQTGDRVGIGGFIITGSAPKPVLVRGIGPSLAQFGVPDPLADPVLELHGPAGFPTIINDNWRDTQIPCTDLPPTNDLESAICATLNPGAYTAIIRGKNNGSGVGLVEVYDLGQADSQLANISTRAFVSTGANVTIGGFVLGGGANAQLGIFGVGPSLTASGVSGVLADPTLELRDSNGVLLGSNDDCGAISIHPLDPAEACIEISLPPGAFTAILAGKNGGTGIGLVEIYNVP